MAEGAQGNMLSELKAITECSICTETFKDPRILPCIHTFCLKCMQQMAKGGDKKPGDKLSCPICRKEITLADGEAMGLQKNFFMARLIEMVKILKPVDKDTLCSICLLAEPEDSAAKIPPATMYCIDCRDNLCAECSMHHRKQKLSRDHKVISLENEMNEEELLEKSALGLCDEHKNEQLKLYCADCKMLACVLCFVESHRLHDCRNVSKVADELRPQILADICRVSNLVTEMLTHKEQLENETTEFLTTVVKVENEILNRSSEVKELVDKGTAAVLEELSSVKKRRLKEIENKREDNETHLTILKTFQTYCNGVITKGTDSDICRVVNDLCHRAEELHMLHKSCLSQNLTSMKLAFEVTTFGPSAIKNLIGMINVDSCDYHYISGKQSPFHPLHKANFQRNGIMYNCIEKFILHQKAVICNATQHDVAELMKTNKPSELLKWSVKLSSSVDSNQWESNQKDVVKTAYVEKSLQHKYMYDLFRCTKGKVFVYANPNDCVLGIGLEASDPLSHCRHNWKGHNLLGEWLNEVQEVILCWQQTSSNNSAYDYAEPVVDEHSLTVENEESLKALKAADDSDKFTFFGAAESPFNQWHRCKFVIDGQLYHFAEQYVMHQKAVMLGQISTAQKILKLHNRKDLERLGRSITNTNDEKWNLISKDVVKKANLAKFGQDEKLKGSLFETVGTTVVAAKPGDAVWGIGLSAEDPKAKSRSTWKGENSSLEMPSKPLFSGAKKTASKARTGRALEQKSRKRRRVSFASSIYKVLKQVHPDMEISSKAMSIANIYVNGMFERIANMSRRLARYSRRATITCREIKLSLMLSMPCDQAKRAACEAYKACARYKSIEVDLESFYVKSDV